MEYGASAEDVACVTTLTDVSQSSADLLLPACLLLGHSQPYLPRESRRQHRKPTHSCRTRLTLLDSLIGTPDSVGGGQGGVPHGFVGQGDQRLEDVEFRVSSFWKCFGQISCS